MNYIQIICLANSWKLSERCIAGIRLDSGKWVRPTCSQYSQDGRVPWSVRSINESNEPGLLDVIEIPLESTGPDFGFESENLEIQSGPWRFIRTARVEEIIPFISSQEPILHNSQKFITVSELQKLPFDQRRTLQLIYTDELKVSRESRSGGGNKWKSSFSTRDGYCLNRVTITDPEFVDGLDKGIYPEMPCLVTVSLSMPHTPDNWSGPPKPCWKLIVGVIELSLCEQILVEMSFSNWTIAQGRAYLQECYGKSKRSDLTPAEKLEFIQHLKQPS